MSDSGWQGGFAWLAADAVAAGRRNRLLYNRLWGPARVGSRLIVKAGFNNWQHIVEQPMRCIPRPASCKPQIARFWPLTGRRDWLQYLVVLCSAAHEVRQRDAGCVICPASAGTATGIAVQQLQAR